MKEEPKQMKYILLMSGTRAGVEGYHAWSKQDIEAHMAVLQHINKDLTASGEFIATQGLDNPSQAKVVRGEKNGMPVTDGVFCRVEGISAGLLDRRSCQRAACLRHSGADFRSSRTWGQTNQHAD
jgi:hypothetical protein